MSKASGTRRFFVRRAIAAAVAGLALAVGSAGADAAAPGTIAAVGVENEYADVIREIGGKFVDVSTILTDPNTDPHTFEASPRIARQFAGAQLVVENGLGYDAWADKLMSAAARPNRKVINVQRVMGLPDGTPNPHLWYDPKTMPAVAQAIADALSALQPAHADVFRANLKTFDASLDPWRAAIAEFKAKHDKTPVAVTEPVANYLLEAMGCEILTPFSLQTAVMNGTDPSPQDVSAQNELLSGKKVAVFAYNQQVTDALTTSFLQASKRAGIPVVGTYETMPTPGYTYGKWMLAEVAALNKAVTDKVSTEALVKRR